MSIKKGHNNFKKIQDQKVKENTLKIENALNNLPKKIDKVTLSKVVKLVANETGLHFTTINKNEKYTAMCNEKYLNFKLNDMDKGKKNKNVETDNEIRLLKLDNTNLKNQIIGLKNVIQRFKLNFEQRRKNINEQKIKLEETEYHEILSVDPLSSLFENSNGNK